MLNVRNDESIERFDQPEITVSIRDEAKGKVSDGVFGVFDIPSSAPPTGHRLLAITDESVVKELACEGQVQE